MQSAPKKMRNATRQRRVQPIADRSKEAGREVVNYGDDDWIDLGPLYDLPPDIPAATEDYATALFSKASQEFPVKSSYLPGLLSTFAKMLPRMIACDAGKQASFPLQRICLPEPVQFERGSPRQFCDLLHEPMQQLLMRAQSKSVSIWLRRGARLEWDTLDDQLMTDREHTVVVPYWAAPVQLLVNRFAEATLSLSARGTKLDIAFYLRDDGIVCHVFGEGKEIAQQPLLAVLDAILDIEAAGGSIKCACLPWGFDLLARLPYPAIYEEKSLVGYARLVSMTHRLQEDTYSRWSIAEYPRDQPTCYAATCMSDDDSRPAPRTPSSADSLFIDRVRETAGNLISSGKCLDLETLASNFRDVGGGRSLQRRLRALGLTYKRDIERPAIMQRAASLLTAGMVPKSVACEVGFSDISRFGRVFKQHFGVSPTDYVLRARSR